MPIESRVKPSGPWPEPIRLSRIAHYLPLTWVKPLKSREVWQCQPRCTIAAASAWIPTLVRQPCLN